MRAVPWKVSPGRSVLPNLQGAGQSAGTPSGEKCNDEFSVVSLGETEFDARQFLAFASVVQITKSPAPAGPPFDQCNRRAVFGGDFVPAIIKFCTVSNDSKTLLAPIRDVNRSISLASENPASTLCAWSSF